MKMLLSPENGVILLILPSSLWQGSWQSAIAKLAHCYRSAEPPNLITF
jgi:hypothetical protein